MGRGKRAGMSGCGGCRGGEGGGLGGIGCLAGLVSGAARAMPDCVPWCCSSCPEAALQRCGLYWPWLSHRASCARLRTVFRHPYCLGFRDSASPIEQLLQYGRAQCGAESSSGRQGRRGRSRGFTLPPDKGLRPRGREAVGQSCEVGEKNIERGK